VHYESYQYVGDGHGTFLSLPLFATLGVRWRELLVNAGWSITPGKFNDDSFSVPFWRPRGAVGTAAFVRLRLRQAVGGGVDDRARGAVRHLPARLGPRRYDDVPRR
jgi:hypothetical protein